jgi:mannose-6-phosphate isomerase-like protein (cupin superfamily)
MRTTYVAFGLILCAATQSHVQQPTVKVVEPAEIDRVIRASSDPNPFSELAGGDGYRLTLRRRTQLDVASRHERRVEVYHVLDGSATLVTGGQLRAPRTIDDEGNFEGSGIDGGTSRAIGKGAVVLIDAGVPHWFSTINGQITYTTTWILR